jgi:hypothetical protein
MGEYSSNLVTLCLCLWCKVWVDGAAADRGRGWGSFFRLDKLRMIVGLTSQSSAAAKICILGAQTK